MKKVFLLMTVALFVTGTLVAQITNPVTGKTVKVYPKPVGDEKTTPNYFHNLIYYYMQFSEAIVVPDSVITLVKNHSAKYGISEAIALKSSFYLKPLYNPQFTAAEHVELCRTYMKIGLWPEIVPWTLYTDMIANSEPHTK